MRAEIVKINCDNPELSLVKYAADQIRSGEVLGMPTDTFYGLAADPFNLRAVDKVYDIKTRSRHKPLSLLIESVDQAAEMAKDLPDEFYALARKFWPGPLTIIVESRIASASEGHSEHWQRRLARTQRQDSAGRRGCRGDSDHGHCPPIPAAPPNAPAPSRCAINSTAASASSSTAASPHATSPPPSWI